MGRDFARAGGRWAGAALVAAAVLPLFGPPFVRAFRPPDGIYRDFLQEWLSARNARAGLPAYGRLDAAFRLHVGGGPEIALPYNAHPPAAVLLARPLAGFDYPTAHLLWNLLTAPLVPLCVWWTARELGRPLGWPGGVVLAVLGTACAPLVMQLLQGQMNPVLLLLVTLGWTADRRGRPGWAGALVGAAAAVKLTPAFLFVYFAFAGRWRAVAAGTTSFLGLNLLAAGVLGPDAVRDYLTDALPSLGRFQRAWPNLSVGAVFLRLFDPDPREKIDGLVSLPGTAAGLAWAARAAVAGVVAWRAATARTPVERDRAFAAAVVGMLLASPITWNHAYLLLPLPLAVVLHEARGHARWPLYAAVAVMWLPDTLPYHALSGAARAAQISAQVQDPPITLGEHLAAAAVLHAPLLLLLARLVRRPPDRKLPVSPTSNGDRS